ncbi:hypothetical protein D3C73_701020 [compost metagenome]
MDFVHRIAQEETKKGFQWDFNDKHKQPIPGTGCQAQPMDGRLLIRPENCAAGKIAADRNHNAGYNRGRTDIRRAGKMAEHSALEYLHL